MHMMEREEKTKSVEEEVDALIREEGISVSGCLDELEIKALNRDLKAACLLGYVYEYGLCNVKKDERKGMEYLVLASVNGSKEAREEISSLALEGNGKAMYALGKTYLEGKGFPKDERKAFQMFEKGSLIGEEDCMASLGYAYISGEGVEKDIDKGLKLIRESALKGSPVGERYMGLCSLTGAMGEAKKAKALEWYMKAIDHGDRGACFELGERFERGFGFFKDDVFALSLFEKGAKLKDTRCMIKIAECHMKGKGVEKDPGEAYGWYEKAAMYGDTEAMVETGNCLREGEGTKKDEKAAFAWYQRAYRLGERKALYSLAFCYEEGIGTRKDQEKAFSLYLKAYERNGKDFLAMRKLAKCYSDGLGTGKDNKKAKEYREKFEEETRLLKERLGEEIARFILLASGVDMESKE